jgi:hypothetical protein
LREGYVAKERYMSMRKTIARFGAAAALLFLSAREFSDSPALAAAGCCKQRATQRDPWYDNGMNFDQCKAANAKEDPPDNLFDPKGLIWWDVTCVR